MDRKVAYTTPADTLEKGDLIRFAGHEGTVVDWQEENDTDIWLRIDDENTGDIEEILVRWDRQIEVLVADYDDVEV